MRTLTIFMLLAAGSLHAQSRLPQKAAARENGPQPYRFTVDYYNFGIKSDLLEHKRIAARYTRNLPDNKVRWDEVTTTSGKELADVFPPPQKIAFMEGFTYTHTLEADMLKPEFFPGFPPLAMQERTLVWDTHMLENFAVSAWDKLARNQPYHYESGDAPLAGGGTFHNHDVLLTWIGNSDRDGVPCALIEYRAFFNKVDVNVPPVSMQGRSHYWGMIWVALSTHQVEYATLYEDVLGDVKAPGLEKPMTINVFRIGSLARAGK